MKNSLNSSSFNSSKDKSLRKHLLFLLAGEGAHAKFDAAVKGLPAQLRGARPATFPHSAWMLLEHMRLAQLDILDFSRNAKYVSPQWPSGYWPKTEAPPSAAVWSKSIRQFHDNLKSIEDLISNPKTDLFAPIAWGDGQTILREALLVADHTAYHVGQMIVLRRLLGAWKE